MRPRRPSAGLLAGRLLTSPAAFFVAGMIDVACALPALVAYLWRQRARPRGRASSGPANTKVAGPADGSRSAGA